jgi:glycosyltransferase involved in cell wall biosynthesis
LRLDRSTRLRIAMLAPPWISVPPDGYGGIEAVVSLLSDELVRRGHIVTLFCAAGSHSGAMVRPLLDEPHPDRIGEALFEADHVSRAFAEIEASADAGRPFDIVHDHSGFTALAMADSISVPLVHTLHGEFDRHTGGFYACHGRNATLVALSAAQKATAPLGIDVAAVIPNPVAVSDWPFQARKDEYLLWIGRICADKGPERAIEAARRAGRPLVLAGPVQPGQEMFFDTDIAPHLDGRRVTYAGEVAGRAKTKLFASAWALLMPISWAEPFGMVMVEALACGTPAIAFAQGAAREIVVDGENGFLVEDEAEMAAAVERVRGLSPWTCRRSVASRYDVRRVAARYEALYRTVLAGTPAEGVAGIERHSPAPRAGFFPDARPHPAG